MKNWGFLYAWVRSKECENRRGVNINGRLVFIGVDAT